VSESGALAGGITFVDNGNGTGTLSGTPTDSGLFSISFRAQNGSGSPVTQSFTLTVNRAPAITSANNTMFTAGVANSFTVTTTGYPTAGLSETGPLPGGVTFSDNGNGTGTLSGTPTASGPFSISFKAQNGVGSPATQTFALTVNQAPAITSANNATFTIGMPGSFTVTTAGYPVSSIVVNGSVPNGLNFVDNGDGTGTLAGTPKVFVGGPVSISFTASNGIGSGTTQAFTVILNQTPAFTSANNATFPYEAPNSFTVTTAGYPAASLAVKGALPAGVTFVDNHNGTGTLAGKPSAGGTFAVVFSATNVVGTATQNFSLNVPGLSISPSPLNFGTVYLNGSYSSTVTLTNVGSSTITISGVSITAGTASTNAYKATSHCGTPLKAGKSCTITVTFLANALNLQTATLNIIDSAMSNPQQVALSAYVIDPIAQFSPTKLAFGAQAVNSSTTLPVELTNTGQTPLDIGGIAITGTNSGEFSQVNNCPAVLAPTANCRISVTFAPTLKGARTGTLTVTDNVTGGNSTVALSGTGH
jgi:hypothetical protein